MGIWALGASLSIWHHSAALECKIEVNDTVLYVQYKYGMTQTVGVPTDMETQSHISDLALPTDTNFSKI